MNLKVFHLGRNLTFEGWWDNSRHKDNWEGLAMALYDLDTDKEMSDFSQLPHLREFKLIWNSMTSAQRDSIEIEINGRLDELVANPDPNWGSITNASIEGGKPNPNNGIPGDWTGTVFEPIYELAGMFYGNVWKKVIIERPEHWIGIHSDPTFPQRGITLQGKTYFLDRKS
jgi:hypothetical protein